MSEDNEIPPMPGGHQLSERAATHVSRPVAYVEDGQLKQRDPSPEEIASRTREAFKALGKDGLYSASPPQIDDRLEMQGHRPGVGAGDYNFSLPPGTPDGSHNRIAGFLTALEFSPTMGNHIAESLGRFGRELAANPKDEPEILAKQQRFITEWAARHGWNLQTKTAAVREMLKNQDASVVSLAMSHGETLMRLMMHADVRGREK